MQLTCEDNNDIKYPKFSKTKFKKNILKYSKQFEKKISVKNSKKNSKKKPIDFLKKKPAW